MGLSIINKVYLENLMQGLHMPKAFIEIENKKIISTHSGLQ